MSHVLSWWSWLLLMLPFPGALPIAAVMCALTPVDVLLERRRARQHQPGMPVLTPSRPGYRGWTWYVEDGQAHVEQ